jgi:hypothetical protein
MNICIPKNDYVQPAEVRQEVVQGICEAFLAHCAWSCFHPFSSGVYRQKTTYIRRHKGRKEYFGFADNDTYFAQEDEHVKFNGAEMKAAFKALQDAGYYMYRVYEYGSWMGYIVYHKPVFNGCGYSHAERVTEFTDFID